MTSAKFYVIGSLQRLNKIYEVFEIRTHGQVLGQRSLALSGVLRWTYVDDFSSSFESPSLVPFVANVGNFTEKNLGYRYGHVVW